MDDGDAVTLAPVLELSPVPGDHVYVPPPPAPVAVITPPVQALPDTEMPGAGILKGLELTDPLKPPPVTLKVTYAPVTPPLRLDAVRLLNVHRGGVPADDNAAVPPIVHAGELPAVAVTVGVPELKLLE